MLKRGLIMSNMWIGITEMVGLVVLVAAVFMATGVAVWACFGEYWRQWKDMRDE